MRNDIPRRTWIEVLERRTLFAVQRPAFEPEAGADDFPPGVFSESGAIEVELQHERQAPGKSKGGAPQGATDKTSVSSAFAALERRLAALQWKDLK